MSSFASGITDIVSGGLQSALTALRGGAIRPDDSLFVQRSIYFFELRVPPTATRTGNTRYIFPLALNPDSLSVSEPFTVEATPTLGGGLVVEEGGIVQRTIRLRGTFGVYQRPFQGMAGQLDAVSADRRDASRSLSPEILGVLSGQKLFQYLNDSVFRVYSALKRDPATAIGTSLLFHMPREEEAWEVVPTRFDSNRTSGRPLDYPYEIELLAVQKAELADDVVSSDQRVLDGLSSALRSANTALTRATAAVNALTAAQGQLRNYFRQFDVILTQAGALVTAVGRLVEGAADLIEMPAQTVRGLATVISQALDTYVRAEQAVTQVPETYVQSLRQLEGACYYLLVHPSLFAQGNAAAREAEAAVRAYQLALAQSDTQPLTNDTTIASNSAPAVLGRLQLESQALLAAQFAAAQTQVAGAPQVPAYTGSRPYVVQAGDTLSSIAARQMGDGRLWRYLAAANSLRPPYASYLSTLPLAAQGEVADVGQLALGDVLQVPDYSQPINSDGDAATLGVPPTAPVAERAFGADFALAAAPTYRSGVRVLGGEQQLDWVVDPSRGRTGLKHAVGLDNLAQGLLTRVSLTRGTDPLYPELGIDPVVGSSYAEIDRQTVAFNLRTALLADPRVQGVEALTVTRTQAGDGLEVRGQVSTRALQNAVPIVIPLGGGQV